MRIRGNLLLSAMLIDSVIAGVSLLQLNTGAKMPALGFGTYTLQGEPLKQVLVSALNAGYRHIDTAAGYENEAVVADAIAESRVPREDIFLTTKLWCTDHGEEEAFDAIIASLGELRTEYVDLFLIHAPANLGESEQETVELRLQSWSVMESLHAAGVLRAIGVSNFEQRHIEQILEWGSVVPAVNQVELHAHLGQRELRTFCAKERIHVTGYGAVGARGLLDDPTVQRIAAAKGRSAAQISLRHTLQRGCAALARSTTPARIASNLETLDFELTAQEMSELEGLERGERSYWDNSAVP